MIELSANLLVAFLLVLTTIWCVLLYRRLARLRVERSDIEAFVTAIDTASQRAEAAIAGIRESALEAQRTLGSQKELAQQRIGELSRLVDNAGRMARRVETALHQGARRVAESGRAEPIEQSSSAPGSSDARPAARRREATPGGPKIDAELLRALEALR